jgi:hypothetical protein
VTAVADVTRGYLPAQNIQLLALRLSDSVDVDPVIYCRLVRDLAAIRKLNPRMSDVHYRPDNDGRTLTLTFDAETWLRVKSSAYEDWDHLNQVWGPVEIDMHSQRYVGLKLSGLHKLEPLCAAYRALPGVTSAEPDQFIGDGSTIYVTRHGRVWNYLFDEAGGDCPAGCTIHRVHYFVVNGAAAPRHVADWNGSGTARPDWINAYYKKYP